eukprot:Gregarina_sp_Pseudo_9__200@NODE_112_length_4197_cov_53_172439_g104_i0_p2_GENE_NODE_112_length_4197_cov_53_172439_g104_i0NODE_112_length_4197_cov_53_172439_g104_i0_p2_ORF_typecomplete_len266_score48_66SLD3/PF08639_10/33_NODE_112_length_4197_cov_53_172439_g104_i032944091
MGVSCCSKPLRSPLGDKDELCLQTTTPALEINNDAVSTPLIVLNFMSGLSSIPSGASSAHRPPLHPRRSSIASNRPSEHLSLASPTALPLSSSHPAIDPPALNPHLASWKVETRAKLERVLSRGPSIRLVPSVIQPTLNHPSAGGGEEDEDEDELSSVCSEHVGSSSSASFVNDQVSTDVSSVSAPNLPSRSLSFSSRRRSSQPHLLPPISTGPQKRMCFQKRQSGFMFDPDDTDEKKQQSALQFAEGVKELQLKHGLPRARVNS